MVERRMVNGEKLLTQVDKKHLNCIFLQKIPSFLLFLRPVLQKKQVKNSINEKTTYRKK